MGLFDPRVQNNSNLLIFKIRGQFISDINIIKLLTACENFLSGSCTYFIMNFILSLYLAGFIHVHISDLQRKLCSFALSKLCKKKKNYLNSLPLPLSPLFSPRCGIASLSITGLISKMSASNISWQIDFQVKIPHVWNITKRTFSYLGD